MYQDNEELDDPKNRVPPPPYTPNDPQQVTNTANAAVPGLFLVPLGQGAPETVPNAGVYIVQATPYVLPMVINNQSPKMGPNPASITCPSCEEVVVTTIKARPNKWNHTCTYIFCLICCWPCLLIPYCVNKYQDLDHYCPHCNSYIGSYLH